MPIEHPPRNPVPRGRIVPNGVKHTVKDGESWETLAERYGLSADEIILANFGTLNHAEVNWYLRHYVGCVKTTRDGKNWMFSSAAKHPVILIPPKNYTFPDLLIIGDPLFYVLDKRPEDWSPPSESAKSVVSRKPFQHNNNWYIGTKVYTRTGWGALEPTWGNKLIYYNTAAVPLTELLNTVVVHHTDNQDSIQDVERKHKGEGFAVIGYHFYIDEYGRVFEGRPLEIMGSHAGQGSTSGGPTMDPDWGAIGIVLKGDFHRETGRLKAAEDAVFSSDPSAKQLQSLEDLVVGLQKHFPIRHLLMHRDVKRGGTATVCPGDVLVPHIEKLQKKVNLSVKSTGGP
ncbi:MAG: N-acetylmuramoyl-L-alanine amidase [Hyphomicrobiales bacterium]